MGKKAWWLVYVPASFGPEQYHGSVNYSLQMKQDTQWLNELKITAHRCDTKGKTHLPPHSMLLPHSNPATWHHHWPINITPSSYTWSPRYPYRGWGRKPLYNSATLPNHPRPLIVSTVFPTALQSAKNWKMDVTGSQKKDLPLTQLFPEVWGTQ